MENKFDVAIVGAGIVGLAIAYTAAKKGNKVVVFERSPKAVGASVRNFGLIWPIGQPPGVLLERAMRARATWLELAGEAGLQVSANGSLHLAYRPEEQAVLEEFMDTTSGVGYDCALVDAQTALEKSPAVVTEGLRTALWSKTELTVSSRQAIPRLAEFLHEKYGVEFHFGTAITHVESGFLSDFYEVYSADRIYICGGQDFETLYPAIFRESGITRCKLQMMRTGKQPNDWSLGASLCAGLTLRHYDAFAQCTSLKALSELYDREMPEYGKWGIHVLLSQNGQGHLIIGDSHEYGWDVTPFDQQEVNELIIKYLKTFANFPDWEIAESWHGVYPKIPGQTNFVRQAEEGVWIVNGLSGAGMTLSFGLATEIV
ncbi:MAG: TIGR03364 family FAD-dependent oxidoreductase [Bacteroidota bacterium]